MAIHRITTPELPEGAPVETGIKGRLYPVEGPIVHGKYFKPTGLLFLKITKGKRKIILSNIAT